MKRSASLFGSALLAALPVGVLLTGCSGGGVGIFNATPTPIGTRTPTPIGTVTATPTGTRTPTPTATSVGGAGTFTANFSANASNISTATFTPATANGVFSKVGNLRTLIATYVQVVGTSPRTISVTISDTNPFQVGDSFGREFGSPYTVLYSEGAGTTTKAFASTSTPGPRGTITITAVNGRTVSFTVTDVPMIVADGNGLPNSATGTFTLNGTGSATAQSDLS